MLPEAFAQDATRMARFEREAQVLAGGLISFHYDVTPDGQRFLVDSARQAEGAAASEAIMVVTNWMAGSKK